MGYGLVSRDEALAHTEELTSDLISALGPSGR
jgi:hypothetical protein